MGVGGEGGVKKVSVGKVRGLPVCGGVVGGLVAFSQHFGVLEVVLIGKIVVKHRNGGVGSTTQVPEGVGEDVSE